MGLWTLGGGGVQLSSTSSSDSANGGSNKVNASNSGNNRGSNGSKNPIAGMLQRELGISAQQGRKILDQRQKIQNVCSNLKKVRRLLFSTILLFSSSLSSRRVLGCFKPVFKVIGEAESAVREKDPNVP